MKRNMLLLEIVFLLVVLPLVSGIIVKSTDIAGLNPGGEADLHVVLENNLNRDVEDVSFSLDFSNLPISSVGGSEKTIDEINDDDSETLKFRVKASPDAKPGDYHVPYSLTFKNNTLPRKGTIGVSVRGRTELSYSVEVEKPVVGEKSKLTLRIINKGFGDAKFVSVSVLPQGFTMLSGVNNYIGSVGSDDFETASFDVLFNNAKANFAAIVEYRDFDNNLKTEQIALPIEVYSRERAIELGVINKSNYVLYAFIVILIVAWFLWRVIRARRRKKSLQE